MEILTACLAMVVFASLCVLAIFRISPEAYEKACEAGALILLSRAAAHRASRNTYQEMKRKRAVALGGTVTEDSVLALLAGERPIGRYERVEARAALRAGER